MSEPRMEVGELWRQVNRKMHERCRHAFRATGLPLMAMVLIREIGQQQGVSVSELARRSGTVKSHVSKLVDHLSRQGYLEKRPDAEDQRLSRIYLTPSAAATMAEMEGRAIAVWQEILAAVPDGQLAEVAGGLQVLLTALERLGGDSPTAWGDAGGC